MLAITAKHFPPCPHKYFLLPLYAQTLPLKEREGAGEGERERERASNPPLRVFEEVEVFPN